MRNTLAILGSIILLSVPSFAFAKHNDHLTVRVLDGTKENSFNIDLKNSVGGATVALADIDEDGVSEIILGNGIGNEPLVRILKTDGTEITRFLAYAPQIGVGINVIACDLDGNGTQEIITAPQRGGGPHIRVFTSSGQPIDNGGFFAYAKQFKGGVNLACGNLDETIEDELVTLPAAEGGPHVRVWGMQNEKMHMRKEFFSGDANDARGLLGVVSDKKLFLSSQTGKNIRLTSHVIHSPLPALTDTEIEIDGVGITSIFTNDTTVHAVTTTGRIITASGADEKNLEKSYLAVAAGNLDADAEIERVVVPTRPAFEEGAKAQSIIVDISEQQLYAYERGNLAHTFPVSSGKYPWQTPQGNTQVLAKIYEVRYAWTYGPANPNNYDLGVIPYNLRIFPHIYIHYAPWHNNFGHPMSHGCVNVSLENIQWLYEWAQVGTPVEVRA